MSTALRRFDPSQLIRSAPIALPQFLALLALVTLSASEGGYPIGDWTPAAVLVALLLIVSIVALPTRSRPAGSRAAIVLVAGFAVWTGLSILWADDRGAAAIATTRTALLAATFVLCARWRHAPRTVAVIITLLTAGLGIIAWGVLFRLHAATDLDPWFLYDRLLEPIGYVNAGAAFFGVTAFLGVGLLGGKLPAPHRLVGALVSVPAASLSLLCLSRGGLIATVLVVILILAFLPGRARNGAAFAVAGLGFLLALSSLLDVGAAVRDNVDAISVLRGAVVKVFVGTALTTLATWVWIGIDAKVAPGDPLRSRASKLGAGLIAAVAVVAVVAAVSEKGPVTVHDLRHAAQTITRPYAEQPASESRLSAGLNSGRWDFWTVAWEQFRKSPIIGDGADNFRQDYLIHGASPENPTYPHSLWLRSLGQLGLIGTALLLGWVLIVVVSIRRLAAGTDPAGRAVAVAAGGAFGLWVVHGSADWLLEYGGLSAIVAAAAGLVVAASPGPRRREARAPEAAATHETAPTPESAPAPETASAPEAAPGSAETGSEPGDGLTAPGSGRRRLSIPPVGTAVGVGLLALTALWSATQWIADRDRESAAAIAFDQPGHALDRAKFANGIEPFGEEGQMLIGALAVARNDNPAAAVAFDRAYHRNPRAARPRMWVGVIASATGDQAEAEHWLRAAARAAPRDPTIKELLAQVQAGTRLAPRGVASELAAISAQLTRDPDPVAPTSPSPSAVNAPAATG